MMKTRHDNDVTDHAGAFYRKNEIELSWTIGSSVIYDEHRIGQWRDRSYRYSLRRKQY